MAAALAAEFFQGMAAAVRSAGFPYVAVDCDGYRSGSMNELLPAEMLDPARNECGSPDLSQRQTTMKIGTIECFAGISGDMLLGALIDAGVPVELAARKPPSR